MPTFGSELDRLADELAAHQERNEAYKRWRALMKSRGVEADEAAWAKARECGCNACAVCRPDLDSVAHLLDVPFLNVLILCKTAEAETLDRALTLVRPSATRTARRQQERVLKKTGRTDKLAELRRRAASADPESATDQELASTLSTST